MPAISPAGVAAPVSAAPAPPAAAAVSVPKTEPIAAETGVPAVPVPETAQVQKAAATSGASVADSPRPQPQPEAKQAVKPEPVRTAVTGRSITGVSIANLQPVAGASAAGGTAGQTGGEAVAAEEAPARSVMPEEAEKTIAEKYADLLRLWTERQRPRLATALTAGKIQGSEVVVSVPNEVLADEINQAKWEIEHDLRQLTGVAATVTVVVSEVQQEYKPVSTEDKLQYLVDLNPNILKLREELDLTI